MPLTAGAHGDQISQELELEKPVSHLTRGLGTKLRTSKNSTHSTVLTAEPSFQPPVYSFIFTYSLYLLVGINKNYFLAVLPLDSTVCQPFICA